MKFSFSTVSFPRKRESRVKKDEPLSLATLDPRLRGGDSGGGGTDTPKRSRKPGSPADRAADFVPTALFAAAATLGVLMGGSFAALGIGAAPILAILIGIKDRRMPWPNPTLLRFTLLFLIGAAGLTFFSPFPQEAQKTVLKLMSIFIPLSFLSTPAVLACGQRAVFLRTRLPEVLIFGFLALGLLLVWIIIHSGFDSRPMTKLNRGFSYGLLLAGPVLAVCAQDKRKAGLVLLVAIMFCLFLTHSRTTQAAVVVGAGAFLLIRILPRLGAGLIKAGMAVCLAWPFLASGAFAQGKDFLARLPGTLAVRVQIWDVMARRIAEKPLLGWGPGSSDKLPWPVLDGAYYDLLAKPASHPHNAVIQLWVEMGVWGLLAGILASFWVLRALEKTPENVRPYAYGTTLFGFTLLMAAYDLWTDSLWAAMALTVYLFASLFPSRGLNLP